MATLALKELRKAYGSTKVIHGIDLVVDSGDFCVFVGPSGCGKSTLLRMIAGLEGIDSGEVYIDDELVNNITAARRGLAMVFQSYALYPHMSVRQNLSFGLENLNMPKADIAQRVDEAGRMLQIGELMKRKPGQLSGGQRQRVAIGRAVVREPRIFLFDEPLSNLDAELRVAMRGEIAALHKRLGNTMIYVTHDQVEAMTMADKIAVLRKGRIEQYGRALDLYNYPRNTFVAGFIGSPRMNFLDAVVSARVADNLTLKLVHGDEISVNGAGFAVNTDDQVELGIRANHMQISDASAGQMQVKVNSTEQLGGETYIYGEVSEHAPLTLHLPGQVDVQSGQSISVSLVHEHIHLFSKASGHSLRL